MSPDEGISEGLTLIYLLVFEGFELGPIRQVKKGVRHLFQNKVPDPFSFNVVRTSTMRTLAK